MYTLQSKQYNVRRDQNVVSPVVHVLKTNEHIDIIGINGRWLHVHVLGGPEGWIFTDIGLELKIVDDKPRPLFLAPPPLTIWSDAERTRLMYALSALRGMVEGAKMPPQETPHSDA